MPAQLGETRKCEVCGTEVRFLRHQRTGNLAPIESAPTPAGRFEVNWDELTYRTVFTLKKPSRDYHENHYVRCQEAKFFRERSA